MGKIKDFFKRVWHGLTTAGRIILGLLIIGLIVLISVLTVRHNNNKDKNDKDNQPEVAQVYEPSISSPLPADTPSNSATDSTKANAVVAGDSTTQPSDSQVAMVAPDAGVDPNEPVAYENSELKFNAVLPAGTKVNEQKDSVSFTAAGSLLLYKVSGSDAQGENLQSIETQLRNSPSVSNITSVKFAGQLALKFSTPQYGNGITFIANGKIYYLFGNNKHFSTFQLQ